MAATGHAPRPQSNQRGIETYMESLLILGMPRGLNRTSVGLKQIKEAGRRALPARASIEPAWD